MTKNKRSKPVLNQIQEPNSKCRRKTLNLKPHGVTMDMKNRKL